jgi:hypothetical protein
MAISNGYCTLNELKARLGITDSADDTILENVIEAASRAIDSDCNTRFYAGNETRYYTADAHGVVTVDDLLSVSALATDDALDGTYSTTWAATDYQLYPFNSTPYREIRVKPMGTRLFPISAYRGLIKVTGSFGYSSTTPDAINEACLILSARYFKRKDAIFGILGTPELGTIQIMGELKKDSEYQKALQKVKRYD